MTDGQARSIGNFDYIIVGAGSAGCVLANRLSADPSVKVLLLEAGGKDNNIWIHVPLGLMYLIGKPRTRLVLRDRTGAELQRPQNSDPARQDARRLVLDQRHGLCARPAAATMTSGASSAMPAGRGTTCCPISRNPRTMSTAAMNCTAPAANCGSRKRGSVGKFSTPCATPAEQVGIPKTKDYNAGKYEGSAYFDVTQRRGVRWSTATAFLKPARNRPNLHCRDERADHARAH